MHFKEIEELHYIVHIDNVPLICTNGILSYNRAKKISHTSIAMEEIQARRENKAVPNGKKLHEYVNLYFNARNTMLYCLKRQGKQHICVIRVNSSIIKTHGAVIADHNASSDYTRFEPYPDGLDLLDRKIIFSESWDHVDQIEKMQHKSMMCAEVLIPEKVKAKYIEGAYVSSQEDLKYFQSTCSSIECTINKRIFFNLE
ncbi:MAG: DUF4433 domain-containing protein [Actinobacteria bacterium]|nr:MAG: DUF4433 domain-containing protein [Actinomycetota bacterium]